MSIARVALDVPLAQCFDYRAPAHSVRPGERVVVPFGRRQVIGVVLELTDHSALPPDRLKSIARVLPDGRLGPEDLRLLRFAADYYHHPLGQAVLNAVPQRLRRPAAKSTEPVAWQITETARNVDVESLPSRARVKRKLLGALQSARVLGPADLIGTGSTARAAIREFIENGWVTEVSAAAEEPAGDPAPPSASPRLTSAQAHAAAAVEKSLGRYGAFLLFGVTGSGKTEVYLKLCEAALRLNGQILLLVPEIALTPQLEATVRARFPGTRIASLHSGLNETERANNWLAALRGHARIVLGTRLAVFTPMPQLSLIVVDEEHDASLKQTEGFCYSARDLAVARASQRSVPVVLGSATPSLESYFNATTGRYTLLELTDRVNAPLPRIECVALGHTPRRSALAPRVLQAVAEKLKRKEQSLVFINRRGYAPVLMCHACGWLSGCHRCSAQLVLHMPARDLHCHHCGYRTRVPDACPSCGNPDLAPIGQGTQRVEDALVRHFPDARVLRIDRDTTRRKHAWGEMRERIHARDVDILVGTQMLAKGHDFPHLALVCVLNADSLLYSSDFRASERLYALLTQVAGRAGRGETQGEVLIQTEFPEHPVYSALRDQDLHRFANQLLAERGASGFPPYVYQALLRAEAPQLTAAVEFLEHARASGLAIGADVELYDVVPATMVRLAGRERAQLLVQSHSRPVLHAFLRQWSTRLASRKSSPARWLLEVDPVEL